MRIIAGKYRGKKLLPLKSLKLRPTEDRVKEAVFNIIEPLKENALVLDLFGGTGSISLEFASRGASGVTIVEKDERALELIKKNISLLGGETPFTLIHDNADKAIKQFYREKKFFDYIYFDPPYTDYHVYDKVIKRITQLGILNVGGLLIVESDKTYQIKPLTDEYFISDHRKYRDTNIYFIQFRGEKNASDLSW